VRILSSRLLLAAAVVAAAVVDAEATTGATTPVPGVGLVEA